MRTQRLLLAGLSLLAVLGFVFATSQVIEEARDAMATQVRQRSRATATERAAVLSEALRSAQARVRVTASYDVVRIAVEAEQGALLTAALEQANVSPGVTAGTITDTSGAVLAHAGGTMDLTGDDGFRFRSVADGSDVLVTISAPILGSDGPAVGRVHQEYSLSRLVPTFVAPLQFASGSMSLARANGAVLLTTGSGATDDDRLTASAPVAGTGLVAIAGADRSAANHPAATLVWHVTRVLLLTIVGALVLVGVAALVLWWGRRRLVAEREEATRLAATDPLTRLGNRRAFDEALLDIEGQPGRTAIVLVDLDRLKVLNDTYGHAAGDEGLRRLGDALRTCVRPDDLVARIGGDEFAVVLPDAGLAHAEQIADRIRDAVGEITIDGFGPLSACTGAATGPNDVVARTLAHADDQLYTAKRARPTRPTINERLRYVIDRHDLAPDRQ